MPPLSEQVDRLQWYHTITLPDGITTPGMFDTRAIAGQIGLPPSLEGKRCLDVGTADGFWAFEMERRGAAEVVAIDVPSREKLDWPEPERKAALDSGYRSTIRDTNETFELVAGALGSNVQRVRRSVYELEAEDIGSFDFAFTGAVLVHLRDPIGALAAVRRVTSGELMVHEPISQSLTALLPRPAARLVGSGGPTWWIPNKAGLQQMVRSAGFSIEASGRPGYVPWGAGADAVRADDYAVRETRARPLRKLVWGAQGRLGVLHTWLRARPMV